MPIDPVSAAIGIGGSVLSGILGGSAAKKARRKAEAEAKRLKGKLEFLENNRQAIINPYEGATNLSRMATDYSSQFSNPYANLSVATQAAEMKIEQADISLANTLDTLMQTGSGAGGATALAQAALQSKKGVAASIEQQEAQNEKLRAQGQQQLERLQLQEGQRIQGVQLAEGRRVQSADAAGQAFMFNARERRESDKINYVRGQKDIAKRRELGAAQAKSNAIANTWSAVGEVGDAVAGP